MREFLETMLPCGESSEALVGAGLGLTLDTDCIFTEFSLSTESVIMTKIKHLPVL